MRKGENFCAVKSASAAISTNEGCDGNDTTQNLKLFLAVKVAIAIDKQKISKVGVVEAQVASTSYIYLLQKFPNLNARKVRVTNQNGEH